MSSWIGLLWFIWIVIVSSETLEACVKCLGKVFSKLRQKKTIYYEKKCEFCKLKLIFLGHWVNKG